jgi:hypothetical protein
MYNIEIKSLPLQRHLAYIITIYKYLQSNFTILSKGFVKNKFYIVKMFVHNFSRNSLVFDKVRYGVKNFNG